MILLIFLELVVLLFPLIKRMSQYERLTLTNIKTMVFVESL